MLDYPFKNFKTEQELSVAVVAILEQCSTVEEMTYRINNEIGYAMVSSAESAIIIDFRDGPTLNYLITLKQ